MITTLVLLEFSICCGLMLTNTYVNELTVQRRRIVERKILENPFSNHPFLGTVHYGQGGSVRSFNIPELVMLA